MLTNGFVRKKEKGKRQRVYDRVKKTIKEYVCVCVIVRERESKNENENM